jgi:hypothetical protein
MLEDTNEKIPWFNRNLSTVYQRLRKDRRPTRYLRTDKDDRFELDEAALHAHEKLKVVVTSAPVLALPRSGARMILETDASNEQLGVPLF